MLALCARFDLESPPTEVKDFKDQLDAIKNPPVKGKDKIQQAS